MGQSKAVSGRDRFRSRFLIELSYRSYETARRTEWREWIAVWLAGLRWGDPRNFGRLPWDGTCESGCISSFFGPGPIRVLSIARAKLSIRCETTFSRTQRTRPRPWSMGFLCGKSRRAGGNTSAFPRYLSSDEEIGLPTPRPLLTRHLRALVNFINRTPSVGAIFARVLSRRFYAGRMKKLRRKLHARGYRAILYAASQEL